MTSVYKYHGGPFERHDDPQRFDPSFTFGRRTSALEPLRILDRRRVKWLDHRVTFYALGTSHAILLEYGDTALTELLTCVPLLYRLIFLSRVAHICPIPSPGHSTA